MKQSNVILLGLLLSSLLASAEPLVRDVLVSGGVQNAGAMTITDAFGEGIVGQLSPGIVTKADGFFTGFNGLIPVAPKLLVRALGGLIEVTWEDDDPPLWRLYRSADLVDWTLLNTSSPHIESPDAPTRFFQLRLHNTQP